jgi:regulator of protease activity HflC (stomatin/prohibitin superfamily)
LFDKLVDVIIGWLEALRFLTVVADYERTVLLRLGRYRKTLEPGLHWLIPLADEILTCYVVPNTLRLHDQSLTTKDGRDIAVGGIITYRVVEPKVFLLEVEGGAEAVADSVYGAVAEWVAGNDYDHVRDPSNWSKLETRVRRAAKDYGIEVVRFKFADMARAKALRLLGMRVGA